MRKKRRTSETQVNIDLPRELADQIEAYCDKVSISRKALVELAVRRLLNDQQAA